MAGPGKVEKRISAQDRGRRAPRFAASKFAAPKAGFHLVHRARLMKRLDEGEDARLTLVVASAGAGKTALLADWSATHSRRLSVWLSCDAGDADPTRFVAALIEAFRRSSGEPRLGDDALQLLTAERAASADVMAALADDVERLGAPLVAIVDDFHLTGHGGVEVLSWLLESRPENLQVVIATRVDPALRLHRMRASCELVEVREPELAFSIEESTDLLSRFGVQLDDADVAEVQRRSEGWAAGLQMTAISIQHRLEPSGPANRVEFNRHAVTGYFLDEVLYRQPERVGQFMLATSILDELSASSCTALCGAGGAALLERIYHDHLFVSLFDEAAGSYRYHSLIKEVLRAELRARHPRRERQLHVRAARYLADHGRAGPAARHLLDAGDAGSAFQLLNDGVIADFGTNPALGSALDDIQPEDFAGHPEILVPLATELLLRGSHARGARAFDLALAAGAEGASPPDLAFRLAVVGSTHHLFRGELEEALAYRDQGHNIVSQTAVSDDWLVNLDAIGAVCHLLLGNFDEALQLVEEEAAAVAARWPAADVSCLSARSHMAWAQGTLSEADRWASRALEAAERAGFDRHPSAFFALRTKALLALERREFGRAAELTERRLDADWPFLNFVAQLDRARIWAAEQDLDEALASLPAVRRTLPSDRSTLLADADELEARIRLALGDASGAMTIADRLPDRRRGVISAMVYLQHRPAAAGPGGSRRAAPTTADCSIRSRAAAAPR